MRLTALVVLVAIAITVVAAFASVPHTISYQGVLRDTGGTPVPDGYYHLAFELLTAETGGTTLWIESQSVSVEDGVFNVILGSITPLNLPFDSQYWLAIHDEFGTEFSPRIQLTTAPYAFHAESVEPNVVSSVDGVTNDEGNIDLVPGPNITITPNDGANTITISATGGGDDGDWIISGANVYRASGNVGVGTSAPSHRIGVHSTGDLIASAQFTNDTTGSTYNDGLVLGVDSIGIPYVMSYEENAGLSLGTGGSEVVRIHSGNVGIYNNASVYGNLHVDYFDMDTGAVNGYVLTADGSGNGTWQAPAAVPDADWTISGANIYRASGKVGIGTTNPATDLHVEGDILVPYDGVYHVGDPAYEGLWWNSSTGSVCVGDDLVPLELYAGPGLARVHIAGDGDVGIGTATPVARLHVTNSSYDALKAECTHTATADYIAVIGRSVPTDYYGIGADFEGGYIGVEGIVQPTGNHYYFGGEFVVSGGSGVNYGAYGSASGSGANYGVYGIASGSGTNYAGYFVGNVYATGTVTSGSLMSRIDHPLDPENKYLNQSAVESHEMKTMYDGTVVLGSDGSAWVEMPDWFEALNGDLRYQLTCVGGYAPVYVAEEVRDNRFRIAGGTPGLKVSWQVTGVRHDAFARSQSVPVEEMKPADERGLYTHPTTFGLGKEMSPDYQRMREAEAKTARSREVQSD